MSHYENYRASATVKAYKDTACDGEPVTKLIYAKTQFSGRDGTDSRELRLEVPENWDQSDWLISLMELVRKIAVEEKFTGLCHLRCQIDGGNKPYTIWRKLQDFWFNTTMRGSAFTMSRCIPIWPRLARQ